METCNLHVHTRYSDGAFLPEEVCRMAMEKKISRLGFSEHVFSYKPSLYTERQFHDYIEVVNRIKEAQTGLKIYLGGELDLLCFDERNLETLADFDYLNIEYLRGFHDFKKIEKIRKRFEKPMFMVHTFLDPRRSSDYKHFHVKPKKWSKLIQEMNHFRLGMELTDGSRNMINQDDEDVPYFVANKEFYEMLRGSLLPISVGTDFHENPEELDNYSRAFGFLKKLNLEENLSVTYHLLDL